MEFCSICFSTLITGDFLYTEPLNEIGKEDFPLTHSWINCVCVPGLACKLSEQIIDIGFQYGWLTCSYPVGLTDCILRLSFFLQILFYIPWGKQTNKQRVVFLRSHCALC